jgi:hypothetical protein
MIFLVRMSRRGEFGADAQPHKNESSKCGLPEALCGWRCRNGSLPYRIRLPHQVRGFIFALGIKAFPERSASLPYGGLLPLPTRELYLSLCFRCGGRTYLLLPARCRSYPFSPFYFLLASGAAFLRCTANHRLPRQAGKTRTHEPTTATIHLPASPA